jgi:hypothetical protein
VQDTNKIYEALLNRKGKVCRKQEIVEIAEEYKQKFKSPINISNTVKYLNRHKYAKRIFQSFYYINSADERKRGYCFYEDKEMLFIVLNKLGIKWYVGLGSALYLAGKSWQVPRVLHILNNKFSGEKKILSLKVRFFNVRMSLFSFGLKKSKTANKIEYYYSDAAKTSLDLLYLRKSDKLIKNKQTKKYLKFYPKWLGEK